jgi:hypothetical protein
MSVKLATLLTDIGLHVWILFTFLAIFFFVYISKVETEAFEDQFSELIETQLPELLQKADDATKGAVKKAIAGNSTLLGILNKTYDKPDPAVTAYNSWLMLATFATSFVLLAFLISGLAIRWNSCHVSVPLTKLIIKNAIVFLLVGFIEFAFFWFIGKKYVPAKPSQLVSDIVGRLKNNL